MLFIFSPKFNRLNEVKVSLSFYIFFAFKFHQERIFLLYSWFYKLFRLGRWYFPNFWRLNQNPFTFFVFLIPVTASRTNLTLIENDFTMVLRWINGLFIFNSEFILQHFKCTCSYDIIFRVLIKLQKSSFWVWEYLSRISYHVRKGRVLIILTFYIWLFLYLSFSLWR